MTARRTLVTGGARSGKSVFAEGLLTGVPRVWYVATGVRPDDEEWTARVAVHRARRPASWRTVESTDVAVLLSAAGPGDTLLLDCLALWMAAQMDDAGVWDEEPGTDGWNASADRVQRAVDVLVASVDATSARVVLVTNEVGWGIVPGSPHTRLYRDLLGTLNTRVAELCDEVLLVVAGRAIRL